jgi:hypothetical protein
MVNRNSTKNKFKHRKSLVQAENEKSYYSRCAVPVHMKMDFPTIKFTFAMKTTRRMEEQGESIII